MSIDSQLDLEGLLRIGRLVNAVLAAMARRIVAGVTTAELDGTAAEALARAGAIPSPRKVYGFPGATCISVNDEVVHGVPGDRVIRPGDLVKIDVTAELDGYVADAARTVAVEPASERALKLAACARAAFGRALGAARAGRRTRDIGRAVEGEVKRHGFAVIRELCGHGVGRSIHEEPSVPNYDEPRCRALLTPGLVLTVEPIITEGAGSCVEGGDGWTIRTKDGGLSAHFEETIVITNGEPLVITASGATG
jgi:methionyl aminopeptidase